MAEEWAWYLGFGSVAGILSGMFGIGGGVVIVPFLAWWFERKGFPPDSIMVMAVATSLATIVITSISAVHAHHRRGAVVWSTVFRMAAGILLGAGLGSIIARSLPVAWFKLLFALFLFHVAWNLLRTPERSAQPVWRPDRRFFAGAGFAIGAVSAILGIGGGTLNVPFLLKCNYSIRQAVAISAACGFPIAVAGTAAYAALGYNKPGLPPESLGFVYLPAFAGLIPTSFLFAPVGAYLTHRVPVARLRWSFALVMLAVGGRLLVQVSEPALGLFRHWI